MTGLEQHKLLALLGPMRRDLISPGYRAAVAELRARFPELTVREVPSGSEHWGWKVPEEWRLVGGSLQTAAGRHLLDLTDHPLRVGSYSQPIAREISREELLEHVRTHPHHPDALPFSFHYYAPRWTIGLTRAELETLQDGAYRIEINSQTRPGQMQLCEWLLPGDSDREFVIAAHLCHPAQVSDGLSGVVSGLAVMTRLAALPQRHFSYRLLIGPETVGSVAWLAANESRFPDIVGGLFLEMTGLDQPGALQHAFASDRWVDQAVSTGFADAEPLGWEAPHRQIVGNDERQFNGPGVRIPMLSFSRAIPRSDPRAPFSQYHSSLDTADLVRPERLDETVDTVLSMIDVLERDYVPVARFRGEPFLSGAGIHPDDPALAIEHRTRLMILDYLDGSRPVSWIARKFALPFGTVLRFVDRLKEAGLVQAQHPLD